MTIVLKIYWENSELKTAPLIWAYTQSKSENSNNSENQIVQFRDWCIDRPLLEHISLDSELSWLQGQIEAGLQISAIEDHLVLLKEKEWRRLINKTIEEENTFFQMKLTYHWTEFPSFFVFVFFAIILSRVL